MPITSCAHIEKFINFVDTIIFMTYTEVRKLYEKTYFYRVLSVRKGKKVSKKRKYLGYDLSPAELSQKEKEADKGLQSLRIQRKKTKELRKLKQKIIPILKKNRIKKAGIFGSYARGEQKKNSDIDIIIQPVVGMGLKFVHLQLELEEKLKRKVDLITYNSIHPLLRDRILNEEIRIL